MDFPTAAMIAKIVRDLRITQIIIIGGETTLWRELLNFNRLCRELEIKTVLVTNAMMFGIDSFWEAYQACPNDAVGISLKAGNLKQLNETAGVEDFDTVKRGIQRAVETVNGTVSLTYNSFYTANLPELVALAVECGSPIVKIDFCSTVINNGYPSGEYMVDPKELVRNITRDYGKLQEITGGKIVFEMNMPLCIWPEEFISELKVKKQISTVCQLIRRNGVVFEPLGGLAICNALLQHPVGQLGKDFTDADSLIRFLNSPEVSAYYRRLQCYPSRACAECQWYDDCGGGCPLKWMIYKPDDLIRPKTRGDIHARTTS